MSKNLDETVRLQSEKREEWIREIREERLQGIAEGASSAPRLASSSAESSPGRNECPGTHCSLIEHQKIRQFLTEIKVIGKMEERIGWRIQSENQIEGEEKWQTCWCCRDQQTACRMAQASAEKLEHTGPAKKKKSGLSATERAVGKYARAVFAKRERNRAVCSEHQIV